MTLMGLPFVKHPAKDEKNPPDALSPGEYAEKSALYKAEAVAADMSSELAPDDVVIGADTIVYLDGRVIGKPKDEADAYAILSAMSGRTHTVFTGYALIRGERTITGFVETCVEFRDLTDEEIRAYIATGEPMDKAGAYGVQGRGCILVKKIVGDYFNVIGLPAYTIYDELKNIGAL